MNRDLRREFLDFFRAKEHLIVPSVKLPVYNDPSLLFVNAGMVPFKSYFLGEEVPPSGRIADIQKCLRVSGKHNDLESVGWDGYHQTFFEMMGNWSFNDYFKEEAIAMAWEFLTKVAGIPKERIYATVFEGDARYGIPPDDESLRIWKKFLPESHILSFGMEHNFWEMGEEGPCGPCTEIHVDLRGEKGEAQSLINKGNPDVLELWNIVFIQYNREGGRYRPLGARFVDTGMGYERLLRVVENKRSNYQTSVFAPLVKVIEEITGVEFTDSSSMEDVAVRVIADHLRAIFMAICDDVLPSNTGHGYVIRRLIRRAMRYGYSYLGLKRPFLYKLVPPIRDLFAGIYPEVEKWENAQVVIRREEESFIETLERGMNMLSRELPKYETLPGSVVFTLYDTYGFPPDLTLLIAREHGKGVDMEGFEQLLNEQKERSRRASAFFSGVWTALSDETSRFVGYDTLEIETTIIRKREIKTGRGTEYHYVLKECPFYPEGGGQVGDRGWLSMDDLEVKVVDTRKEHGTFYVVTEEPFLSEKCLARVDSLWRKRASIHHTATHLLHLVLRKFYGVGVSIQKGSLVHPDYLRFDFQAPFAPGEEKLREIEEEVEKIIEKNWEREIFNDVPFKEAIAMGAVQIPEEEYGERVRVVKFGESLELCGGTHVDSSLKLRVFKIIKEEGIAAGVRRITAVAGDAAISFLRDLHEKMRQIEDILNHPPDVIPAIEKMRSTIKELTKNMEKFISRQISKAIEEMKKAAPACTVMLNEEEIPLIHGKIDIPADYARNLAGALHKVERKGIFFIEMPENHLVIVSTLSENVVNLQKLWGEMRKEMESKGIKGGGPPRALFLSGVTAEKEKWVVSVFAEKMRVS